MLKLSPFLSEICKDHGQITGEFLGLRTQNLQGIAFIWTQTYREIFKSTLVYLQKIEEVLMYSIVSECLQISFLYISCAHISKSKMSFKFGFSCSRKVLPN